MQVNFVKNNSYSPQSTQPAGALEKRIGRRPGAAMSATKLALAGF